MHMMPIINILVVHNGGGDAREPVAPTHEVEEGLLELLGVALEDAPLVLAEDLHLTLVRLAHAVALEPVLVAALLLAHLAVPPELLEPFRLHAVRDRLRGEEVVLAHRRIE